MNYGTVTDVITWLVDTFSNVMRLIMYDLDLWQVPVGYFIIGFMVLALVIDYIMR